MGSLDRMDERAWEAEVAERARVEAGRALVETVRAQRIQDLLANPTTGTTGPFLALRNAHNCAIRNTDGNSTRAPNWGRPGREGRV